MTITEQARGPLPPRPWKETIIVAMGKRQLDILEHHTRLGGISKQEFLRRMIDKWIADGTPNV